MRVLARLRLLRCVALRNMLRRLSARHIIHPSLILSKSQEANVSKGALFARSRANNILLSSIWISNQKTSRKLRSVLASQWVVGNSSFLVSAYKFNSQQTLGSFAVLGRVLVGWLASWRPTWQLNMGRAKDEWRQF